MHPLLYQYCHLAPHTTNFQIDILNSGLHLIHLINQTSTAFTQAHPHVVSVRFFIYIMQIKINKLIRMCDVLIINISINGNQYYLLCLAIDGYCKRIFVMNYL